MSDETPNVEPVAARLDRHEGWLNDVHNRLATMETRLAAMERELPDAHAVREANGQGGP